MQFGNEQLRRSLESLYLSFYHDLDRFFFLILLVQDKRLLFLNFIKLLKHLKMIRCGMWFLLYWMELLRLFKYDCLEAFQFLFHSTNRLRFFLIDIFPTLNTAMSLNHWNFLLMGLKEWNFIYFFESIRFVKIITPGLFLDVSEWFLIANTVLWRKLRLNQEPIDCVNDDVEGDIWRPILHKDGHHHFSVFLADVDVVNGIDELDTWRLLRVLGGQFYL